MSETIAVALPGQMKAVITNNYGDSGALKYTEIATPVPQDKQLLIKNFASSVNPIDWKLRSGKLRLVVPLKFPAILGFDYCGQVVVAGKDCMKYKAGDWVYGMSDQKSGTCYAEYICVGENTAAPLPAGLTPVEAATIPLAGLTAWQALNRVGKLKSGDNVLIIGAAGGVGLHAVQIAIALGAKVTALASPHNHALLMGIGVTACADYRNYDFSQKREIVYDIIFDTAGKVKPAQALKQLAPAGAFVTTLPGLSLLPGWLQACLTKQKVSTIFAKSNADDLLKLNALIADKKLKPHIFKTFSLQEIAAAHALSEQGHTVGKIAIDLSV